MTVSNCINRLVEYARSNLSLDERDMAYKTNGILDMLGVVSYDPDDNEGYTEDINQLLAEFVDVCVADGLFQKEDAATVCDKVMGYLSLDPSAVDSNMRFESNLGRNMDGMRWLYRYCVKNTYVKKAQLDKNPRFESHGLVVTINLAKPEFRDPKKAASGNSVKGGYPKCVICQENVGYVPRNKCTLRTTDIDLGEQSFFWQFSPYGYFNQHGICVNKQHIPMHVDRLTLWNLTEFVRLFPEYFIGSNAALPRIGGSVLAHDHYQGGGEILPLHKAPISVKMMFEDYPDVEVGILDWPGTCIRLSGKNRDNIVAVADVIRRAWCVYSNDELGIVDCDEDGQHNAISPTVIMHDGKYEMNIILRCNITSEQYPDGVFHAHPEFHVIKKESIGLIEAQGLFILPGRLVAQLSEMEKCLLDGKLSDDLADFAMIFDETKALVKDWTPEGVHEAVKDELGSVCYRILQNTAVFKKEEQTIKFMEDIGFERV